MIIRILTLLYAVSVTGPAVPAAPDDVSEDQWIKRCVNSRSIRVTEVIDDTVILFRMRGGDYFVNTLQRRCRGLSRQGRFTYDLHSRRLCANDSIRILRDSGGTMYEGKRCKLGEFRKLSDLEQEKINPEKNKQPQP